MTTTDGNQYSFMQGAINVLSVKASTLASLFAVECVRVTDLDNSSRSDAQSLLACAARLLIPFARILLSSQAKEDKLVALLRMTRKFMNIACRLLKSRATMTEWWGLKPGPKCGIPRWRFPRRTICYGALLLVDFYSLQVTLYGFAGSYSTYSEHYYDKEYLKHVFYANHDNNAENKLWEQLSKQGIVRLFKRNN